jgi:hypothetical protein
LVKTILGSLHLTRLTAVTEMVGALLASQSLHPADLARALPGLRTVRARQGMRRVRRLYARTVLTSVALTPWLLQAALRLVDDAEVLLVLDSTRCVHWEVFTLGVRWHGRVLPFAWSILPYPWPKKHFTPTVVALLDRTLAHWPSDRPVQLVADRGFPSLKLFRCLTGWRNRLPLGYTIRLRAGDWVRLPDGRTVRIADELATLPPPPGTWRCARASSQQQGKVSAQVWLVLGYGQPEFPAHQRGPADQARRQARQARRVARLLSKGQSQVRVTDPAWVLLTTEPTWSQAVEQYRGRFSTEGTYRDLQTWDLEAVAAHESDAGHLDGLLGLAAVTYLVQAALGAAAGRADEASARARQRQWSTTDRLSSFWRGRHVLHDHAYDWLPWLQDALPELARQLRADPPSDALPIQSPRHQEAA